MTSREYSGKEAARRRPDWGQEVASGRGTSRPSGGAGPIDSRGKRPSVSGGRPFQKVRAGQPLLPVPESDLHSSSLELLAFVAVECTQSATNVGTFELVQLSGDARLPLPVPKGARIPTEVVEGSGDRSPSEEAGRSDEPLVKTGMGLCQRPVDEQVGLQVFPQPPVRTTTADNSPPNSRFILPLSENH
jgi:hypothetical protein